MSALLPCPFCGGERVGVNYIRDGAQVACRGCHAAVVAFSPNARESAATAWNRRTPAATQTPRALLADAAAPPEDVR